MKLIPRYLLANLVRPWLYILFGFSAIAVLVDKIVAGWKKTEKN